MKKSRFTEEQMVKILREAGGSELHGALHVREEHGDLLALAFERGLRGQDLVREVLRGVLAGFATRFSEASGPRLRTRSSPILVSPLIPLRDNGDASGYADRPGGPPRTGESPDH